MSGGWSNNLYDFLMREYRTAQGRWLRPDPAGLGTASPGSPQTWNRYAYVMNNPTGLIDPSGMNAMSCLDVCGLSSDEGGGPDLGWVGYFFGGQFEGNWSVNDLLNYQTQRTFGYLWWQLPG